MEYEIESDIFWNKFRSKIRELYGEKTIHIAKMHKLMNYLGLSFIETYSIFSPNERYFFKFKVKNKKKLFLRKIEHGF